MKTKNEQLMIIQAIGTCICRKRQKNNRRQRILREAEENKETGLHQLRSQIWHVCNGKWKHTNNLKFSYETLP